MVSLSLKVKVTVQECHSATALSPTRVGLLRHVADKTVPTAASASPSPFISFDYGCVINLQDASRRFLVYITGCRDGS